MEGHAIDFSDWTGQEILDMIPTIPIVLSPWTSYSPFIGVTSRFSVNSQQSIHICVINTEETLKISGPGFNEFKHTGLGFSTENVIRAQQMADQYMLSRGFKLLDSPQRHIILWAKNNLIHLVCEKCSSTWESPNENIKYQGLLHKLAKEECHQRLVENILIA